MIDVKEFYNELIRYKVDFFCGVPDSLLKSFCAYTTANTPAEHNTITANEGAAIGLASGYHIGTGKIPIVYMQNSGLGNAINPLLSLADNEVYSIPILLMIGWRGEPGVKDEPQHVKQGKVTLNLLDAMEIKYSILNAETDYKKSIKEAIDYCTTYSSPYAFVIRKDTFTEFKLDYTTKSNLLLRREEALEIVLNSLSNDSIIVSTTGMLSRELFELRKLRGEKHCGDFLTVGSMGHTSQIALGIAISNPKRIVYCFEGDGGALMHLGSYAILGSLNVNNLKIILFNNGAHDSVGGQPTIGFKTDFPKIFKGFGFNITSLVNGGIELKKQLEVIRAAKSNCFLEIQVKKGARKDLGRPTQTPLQTKNELMQFLKDSEFNNKI